MDKYKDRHEAGIILAEALSAYAGRKDLIILGLPRGGVPVAYEVAQSLKAPLDVFVVRKIGMPGHAELALGAIASGGTSVFNDDIIQELHVTQADMQPVIDAELHELERREAVYRGDKAFPSLNDKTVILVDDGIATGATIKTAIKAIRELYPANIIIAVPVAQDVMCETLLTYADDVVCPLRPHNFYAVGAWYDDFSQTEDTEVQLLLTKANQGVRHG